MGSHTPPPSVLASRQLRESLQKERRLWIFCICLLLALIGVSIGIVQLVRRANAAPQEPEQTSTVQSGAVAERPSDPGTDSDPTSPTPEKPTVCIDPGHGFFKSSGYYDCGSEAEAYKALTGEAEDGFALRMAQALQKELEGRGYPVLLTREAASSDTLDIEMRGDYINRLSPDLCISIHGNESDGSFTATGSWIMVRKGREDSLPFAAAIADAVNAEGLSEPDAFVKEDTTGIVVLSSVSCPSVLIEAAFLDSTADAEKAANPTWQAAYAKAIADAVDRFFADLPA